VRSFTVEVLIGSPVIHLAAAWYVILIGSRTLLLPFHQTGDAQSSCGITAAKMRWCATWAGMLQAFPRRNPMEPSAWRPREAALAAWARKPRASSMVTPRYLTVGVGAITRPATVNSAVRRWAGGIFSG
jgi:hypothetical protein